MGFDFSKHNALKLRKITMETELRELMHKTGISLNPQDAKRIDHLNVEIGKIEKQLEDEERSNLWR